jgi:regulatory protein
MEHAARVLRRRDVSATELEARLSRARIAPAARSETIARLTEAGAVDDGRFALARARALADRGAGDQLVRHDLAARGIAPAAVEEAVASLEPESTRAAHICARRGDGARTARYLARKGFSADTIESSCAEGIAEDAPPAVR